jgi:BlaI family transcriptional regulator, penicillinase repressor
MKNEFPDLSKAEWEVMKKIWELKKTNVREVYEELHNSTEWAYNTVRTMMERLRDKGYLNVKKVGNAYFYEPSVSRSKIVRNAIYDFANKVFDGAIGPIFSTLIKEEKLSEGELDEIRKIIYDKEK